MKKLEEIAEKANKYLPKIPMAFKGFKKCTADNEENCLIFEFDTEENAEIFKFYREELANVNFRMCVIGNTLREYR